MTTSALYQLVIFHTQPLLTRGEEGVHHGAVDLRTNDSNITGIQYTTLRKTIGHENNNINETN